MYIATLTAEVEPKIDLDYTQWAEVRLMFGEAVICTFRCDDWWGLCESPHRQRHLEEFVAEKMRTLLRAPA